MDESSKISSKPHSPTPPKTSVRSSWGQGDSNMERISKSRAKVIEVDYFNMEFDDAGSDAGVCFTVRCPDCGDSMTVCSNQWNVPTCDCGRSWSLSISAYGEKL